MRSNPKISVVMICYNHEKYIGEAINSILSQTYSDFELIIIDDGSSDATLKIIREYHDPRITIVEQKNSGPSIALNTGISSSRGEFIAFMSGDDVSFPNRLTTQIEQIELQKADMIFCLPQIIGPDSGILGDNTCPWFFHKDFDSTAELYRQLFYSNNFLCAPSCFCRRTAIEKVGRFKRGLIQLQDLDYWIRACKKELVIKLHRDVLIQYRYLYGANLSDRRNLNRANIENAEICRSYFDEAPIDLLRQAFGEKITSNAVGACPEVEIDKSFLFLEHSSPAVKTIGLERIISQLEDDGVYEKLKAERRFDTASFFQLMRSNDLRVVNLSGKLKEASILIGILLARYLGFILTEAPRWTDAQVKQRIEYYLERGDYKRAMMVVHGYRRFPPGPTIFATILKVLNKIFAKTGVLLNKAIRYILTKIRNSLIKIRNTPATIANGLIKITDSLVKIKNTLEPPRIMERVFTLSRMYDYSKKADCIAHEEPLEQIYLQKPKVLGNFAGTLSEGDTFSPRAYVSIIDHAIITGGSSLVITKTGDLLSDEMMDYSTDDFGIKSPHIMYRYKNKAILTYKKNPDARVKEGILLSCDHDNNYFHWLVECLPKLLFIDDQKQFKDAPLLIPNGLHENLVEALRRVNIHDHPVINLESGIAYHVNRLIFPSALSRVIDRYKGHLVFDTDIVLSQKWVSRVADLLKNNAQPEKKPWRKLYLTRKRGLRTLGNQEEIEAMLSEHDFEIIDLDGASLDFQIELFSQASVVVAPTGAALTNMLFCRPGTKVIIFMSNHETTNHYFWSNLGNIAGLDVTTIVGERLFNLTNYWSVHDDYVIDTNILLEEIMKHE